MYCNAPSATIANRFLPSWEATGPSKHPAQLGSLRPVVLSGLFDASLVFSLGVAWSRLHAVNSSRTRRVAASISARFGS